MKDRALICVDDITGAHDDAHRDLARLVDEMSAMAAEYEIAATFELVHSDGSDYLAVIPVKPKKDRNIRSDLDAAYAAAQNKEV